MWISSIEINENKTLNGQYTVLYHSPSSSDADFIKFFSEWIEKNHNEEKKHIICGDFNIDMAHTTHKTLYKHKLNEIINENGMKQIIKEYTRKTENTNTLLDLIITNTNEIKYQIDDINNISDHSTIQIVWNEIFSEKKCTEKKTILHKYNKQQLQDDLNRKEYYYCYDKNMSCSEKAEKLIQTLRESVNKFKKEIEIKEKENNKWFDTTLKELKQKRDEAYKKAQNTSDNILWANYKQIRNKYSKMLKKMQQQSHEKRDHRMQRGQ